MHARRTIGGLSPCRRAVLMSAAVLVTIPVVTVVVALLVGGDRRGSVPPPDRPGPVLLVPGYGGGTGGVNVLAERIRPPAGRRSW